MMVRIWTDRIVTMNIHRTGTLQRSVHQQAFSVAPDGFAMQAAYRFVNTEYMSTRVQERATKETTGGDLKFLDPVERAKRGLGATRKRRPWFSVSWDISKKVLNRRLSNDIGKEFAGVFDSLKQQS